MEYDVSMIYMGKKFPGPFPDFQTYREEFFEQELRIESDLFESFRRRHGIEPFRIDESGEYERREIAEFFEKNKSSFFFRVIEGEVAASVLLVRNFIQCLVVAKEYQRMGFGTGLVRYAVNYALDKGFCSVELKVFADNLPAIELYRKNGFQLLA